MMTSEDKAALRRVWALPFVRRPRGDQTDWWSPPAGTGDHCADMTLGASFAAQAIEAAHEARLAVVLPWIIQAMIRKGAFGGIEAGFTRHVAYEALARHEEWRDRNAPEAAAAVLATLALKAARRPPRRSPTRRPGRPAAHRAFELSASA